MIDKCEVCGRHVPAGVALEVLHDGGPRIFCSAACADVQMRDVLPKLPRLPYRILVAIDGSGPSVRAAEMAATLAIAGNGEVQLLAAVHPGWLRSLAMDPVAGVRFETLADQVEGALHESATAQLDRCRRLCERAGVKCTVRIESRPPLEAILDAAKDVDLVVMGSRGRDALTAASLGSHAQRVVTGTRTPVLVVH